MTAEILPFNPLDKKNLGASVAIALLTSKTQQLGDLQKFKGAGIYALYYTGSFHAYEELSTRNADAKYAAPIYIGKAVPSGARKGIGSISGASSQALYNRLSEHAESITVVNNLRVDDFACRYLVVDDIWIPLGESLLIAHFSPLWNALIDGFGNHDPGKGRYEGMRPRWDVLHPGRRWAEKCRERPETADEIAMEVENYLRNAQYPSIDWFNIG
jgi:hypothetical protein